MFRGLIAILTAWSVLWHGAVGCCAHHHHQHGPESTCHDSAACCDETAECPHHEGGREHRDVGHAGHHHADHSESSEHQQVVDSGCQLLEPTVAAPSPSHGTHCDGHDCTFSVAGRGEGESTTRAWALPWATAIISPIAIAEAKSSPTLVYLDQCRPIPPDIPRHLLLCVITR